MPWPARRRPATDVAATGQSPERAGCFPIAELSSVRRGPAQELDREFDVPQATLPSLICRSASAGGDVVLDPSTHRLGVGHRRITSGGRPRRVEPPRDSRGPTPASPATKRALREGLELPVLAHRS